MFLARMRAIAMINSANSLFAVENTNNLIEVGDVSLPVRNRKLNAAYKHAGDARGTCVGSEIRHRHVWRLKPASHGTMSSLGGPDAFAIGPTNTR